MRPGASVTVCTGYTYQPPALGTYRRRREACPQGPTYSTYWVRVPASGVGYVPRTVAPQVAGVVKHADNVLKTYATAVAILATCAYTAVSTRVELETLTLATPSP